MKNYLSLNKETQKIIERNMSKTNRKNYKNGQVTTIKIERRKPLKRWGKEVEIKLQKRNILYNSAIYSAWNYDETKAKKEAKNAIDYFVYGEKNYDWKMEVEFC